MTMDSIRQALTQVQEIHQRVIDRQQFKGFSGTARIVSGGIALGGSLILNSEIIIKTELSHFVGWCIIGAIAMVLNYGAILYWFLFDPQVERNYRKLKPTAEVMPPLLIGAVLSIVMTRADLYQYLFGLWMCMFGLCNLAVSHALPRPIGLVGIYYIVYGVAFLLIPYDSFLSPIPMGIIFFVGEFVGGIILNTDRRRYL